MMRYSNVGVILVLSRAGSSWVWGEAAKFDQWFWTNTTNVCKKKKKSRVTHTYAPPPLTVETYVKKRDLKLDSQLTQIDKSKEGQIAGGGWRRRGSSGNLRLTSYDTWAEDSHVKQKLKKKNFHKSSRVHRETGKPNLCCCLHPSSSYRQSAWWPSRRLRSRPSAPSPTSLTPATPWE